MKRIRYIGKTLKQDETVQTPWSLLVTKHGETKCYNETDTFLSQEIFFLVRFCFITNETIKIYRENSETGCNRQKTMVSACYQTRGNAMKR